MNAETDLSENEIWSVCKLGYQLYVRERYDDARAIFEGLATLDETLGYPWHALGLIARKRDNPSRAAECLRTRLDLDPEAGESRVALAEVLYESGRPDEACELLAPFARTPDDDSEHARRGRVLLERWS